MIISTFGKRLFIERPKMPRQPRLISLEYPMHIMIRGNNRQVLFREDKDKGYFRFLLKKYLALHFLELHHYCLMNNHVHLIIQSHREGDLSTSIKRINLAYYHRFKNKYGYCGHLVQDRFKSIILGPSLGLSQCGKYNELNPVRARIVSDPADYVFSSYRYYALGQSDPLISPSPWYLSLSTNPDERRKHYKNFAVNIDIISKKILQRQRYIGEDDFLREMEEEFGIPTIIQPRGRPKKDK